MSSIYPMATIEELIEKNGTVSGNLIGVDSQTPSIIGYTSRQLRKGGWSPGDINKFTMICLGGNYEHVIATCASVLTFE